MKTTKILFLMIICLLSFSCDNDNDPYNNVCEENYVSTSITNTFSGANGYGPSFNTIDLETHEYTIQINADGEICSIGYQNPNTYSGNYTMEIIQSNNTVLYSGTHTFSQTNIDYQAITPIPVISGTIVTVKRTVLPGYSTLSQLIGPVIRLSAGGNIPYPITYQNVTFLGSDFYGAGGPLTNFAMPVIGLGFKVY